MKAVWNGKTLAESKDIITVEGHNYFPLDSIHKEFFVSSDAHTTCDWKGIASYYNIVVDGRENKDAAWHYPTPSELAKSVKDRISFWKGVQFLED